MLRIGETRLSYSALAYLAFRVSFCETLESVKLQRQLKTDEHESGGFLAEIPFLQAVPPQIQLDALSTTWHRLANGQSIDSSLIDDCVLYAVCESAARISADQPNELNRLLQNGPLKMRVEPDHWLISRLRALHLCVPSDCDFLALSRFEDVAPDIAERQKARLGLANEKIEPLFDLLGRWHVSSGFAGRLKHLLGPDEIQDVCEMFTVQTKSEDSAADDGKN